jgi:hypothetical protein
MQNVLNQVRKAKIENTFLLFSIKFSIVLIFMLETPVTILVVQNHCMMTVLLGLEQFALDIITSTLQE